MDKYKFEKLSDNMIYIYSAYKAKRSKGYFKVGRIRKRKKNIYYIERALIDGSWADIGFFGNLEDCKNFVKRDSYKIFWR